MPSDLPARRLPRRRSRGLPPLPHAAFQAISWQSDKYAHFCPSTKPAPADRPGRTALLISPKAKSTLSTRIFFPFPCKRPAAERGKQPEPRGRSGFLETEGRRVQTPPLHALIFNSEGCEGAERHGEAAASGCCTSRPSALNAHARKVISYRQKKNQSPFFGSFASFHLT